MVDNGIIFNIKKFALHDGPGIRTTIFFFGCPLDCWWCHNPECKLKNDLKESSGNLPKDNNKRMAIKKNVTTNDLISEIKKDIIFYEQSGGGVTFSGGEPLLQSDFLKNCLKKCKEMNIHTTVDTTGYVSYLEFEKINHWVDLYLYDLKIIDEQAHKKYTSVSNKLIIENLDKLAMADKNINIRIPLIPDITDTDINIEQTIETLDKIRNVDQISLLPYNKFGEDKMKRYHFDDKIGKLETQAADKLNRISDKFIKHDYRVSIGG